MADDSTPLSPDLPDELVHEILFRLPPDEPACLVRLSLLAGAWRRLLSDPDFHRRYREFHGKPPMFGFFYELDKAHSSGFAPPTGSCPLLPISHHNLSDFGVCDCRHGRVLLVGCFVPTELVVWDPMTGLRSLVSGSDDTKCLGYLGAAVLCDLDGCDHATCHDGPFRVVFVGVGMDEIAVACVYSSDTGEWGTPTAELELVEGCYLEGMPSVLAGDGLHFLLTCEGCRILKYDLGRHCLSMIDLPAGVAEYDGGTTLLAAQDGGLGIAHLDKFMLHLWSRDSGLDGVAAWTQHRVLDLKSFLPVENPAIKVEVIGSMEGADVIFATTSLGVYSIDLKLVRAKKLWDRRDLKRLIPFMRFYIHEDNELSLALRREGSGINCVKLR